MKSRPAAETSSLPWLVVPALSIVSSLVHLAGLSTPVTPDTPGYFLVLSNVFSRNLADPCLRTPVYGLAMAITNALTHTGLTLIAFQILLRAAACALVARSLGTLDRVAGLTAGILLALDPAGAVNSVLYMTESFSSSGLLLLFALLAAHPKSRVFQRPGTLIAGGLLIGCTLLVRPTGWAFLPPMLVILAFRLRSLVRPLQLAAGFSLVLAAVVMFNGLRTGYYGPARTGLYMAFPIFTHHLFSPENGPSSRTLDSMLRACRPDIDYWRIGTGNINFYVHQVFEPCLKEQHSGSKGGNWALYREAYVEALLARPVLFARRLIEEALLYGYGPATDWVYQVAQQPAEEVSKLCREDSTTLSPSMIRYFCPLPPHSPRVREAIVAAAVLGVWIYQPYLLLAKYFFSTALTAAALLVGYVLIVLVVAVPRLRFPVALAVIFLALNALMTAAGQYVLSRYVSVTSPFFLIITGITAVSLVRRASSLLR